MRESKMNVSTFDIYKFKLEMNVSLSLSLYIYIYINIKVDKMIGKHQAPGSWKYSNITLRKIII